MYIVAMVHWGIGGSPRGYQGEVYRVGWSMEVFDARETPFTIFTDFGPRIPLPGWPNPTSLLNTQCYYQCVPWYKELRPSVTAAMLPILLTPRKATVSYLIRGSRGWSHIIQVSKTGVGLIRECLVNII